MEASFEGANIHEAVDFKNNFEFLFSHISCGIALLDRRGKPLMANSAVHQLAGYDSGELKDMSLVNFIHPEDLNRFQRQCLKLFEGKIPELHQKKRYINKNGEINWVTVSVKAVKDQRDRPDYFIAVIEGDKEKNAEEEKFRELLFKHTIDHFTILDQKGRYQWVSPSSVSFNGYSQNDLVGKDPMEWLHPQDREYVREKVLNPILGGITTGEHQVAFRFRKKDGSYIWVETLFKPIPDSNGKLAAILTNSRDISKRKNAEEEILRLNAALVVKNEELKQHSFNISHRLRTPVVNILGLTELFDPADPEFNKVVIETLKKQATELDKTLREINSRMMLIDNPGNQN